MRKKFLILICFFVTVSCFAQSDEDLFGSSDDSFFEDDGIVEIDTSEKKDEKTTDLSKGVLFQTGTVKIGGTFDLSLTTMTSFYKDLPVEKSFEYTYLVPKADACLTLDVRPTLNSRLYAKAGIHYPYFTESTAALATTKFQGNNFLIDTSENAILNLFYIKELFGDFNIGDYFAFRFGKQTVSWGVGYFFSPADVINLTRIDPENPTAQVEGPLALRTQIVFPGTQNAIWAYIIPDNNFTRLSNTDFGTYIKDTAFALKGDIVLGNWEFGLGGWYKNTNPLKFMLTVTGAIFRTYSVFGESVLSIGYDNKPESLQNDYTPVFQGTLGIMKTWSKLNISTAVQYFYDGQKYSTAGTYGNNLAAYIGFSKIGTKDLTGNIFAQFNFDNSTGLVSGMLTYTPIKEFSVSAGPNFIFQNENVITSIKLVFNLGGGKF